MHRLVHSDAVRAALTARGWDQKRLAEEVGVSGQAVTNWLKGVDFPRPATLLRLATALSLSHDQLVQVESTSVPVVAFRKRAGTKTTDAHLARARAIGALLRPLVEYLPPRPSLRTQVADPTLQYPRIQATVAAVRARLRIGQQAVLAYQHLISEFNANDAVIVPVLWGQKQRHENALHILLPAERVTFIYLNLDSHLEDFKFWMAHELAHVYSPELTGSTQGEDFADAFAGALLFPQPLAQQAYQAAIQQRTAAGVIATLNTYAVTHEISLFSVYKEVSSHAAQAGLPALKASAAQVHAARTSEGLRGQPVSARLFGDSPPAAAAYIAVAGQTFQSPFFAALRAMLVERCTGAGYVQQVLSVAVPDAQAIHDELTR